MEVPGNEKMVKCPSCGKYTKPDKDNGLAISMNFSIEPHAICKCSGCGYIIHINFNLNSEVTYS